MLIVAVARGFNYFVSSTNPGSAHESAVFEGSSLFEALEKNAEESNEWPFKNTLILGDSAYKTRLPNLATPFLQAVVEEDPQRHQYNKAHNAARSQIECVI